MTIDAALHVLHIGEETVSMCSRNMETETIIITTETPDHRIKLCGQSLTKRCLKLTVVLGILALVGILTGTIQYSRYTSEDKSSRQEP